MKLAVVLLLVGIVAVSCIPQRGGGRGGRGRGKGPKACKGNGGIDTCECTDGSTCEGKRDCKSKCPKETNPYVSCTCKNGEEWTRPEPCKDNDGIESCECKDGETCNDLDGCIETCGKIWEIASCTCNDGEEWTKPKKPSKPGKKERPCRGRRNRPVSCTCEDGETYTEDIKENCDIVDNPPQECECKNGDTWVAEEDSEEDSEEE